MDKVYLVMIYETGENAGVYAVYSTAEKAKGVAETLNSLFEAKGWKDMYANYISEEVQ